MPLPILISPCLPVFRFLGLNTVTAYQRAKVYGLKIMNRSLNRSSSSDDNALPDDLTTVSGRMEPDNDAGDETTLESPTKGGKNKTNAANYKMMMGRSSKQQSCLPSQAVRSASYL